MIPVSTFETFYVPILKWKAGEQKALKQLKSEIKRKITPLIEIIPIPWDYTNECQARNIDEHLLNIGAKLKEYWNSNEPLYIDTFLLGDDEKMANGEHYLSYIFKEARKNNIKLIPVTNCERSLEFQKEVVKVHLQDSLGVCVRLTDEDFYNLEDRLSSLLKLIKVDPNEIDLLIDMKYINPNDENKIYIVVTTIINSIPDLNKWRNLILSGCSFPQSLSGIDSGSIEEIPRTEWAIWSKLVKDKKVKRIPIFSDYGINHPEYFEFDPRIMQMSANIRYTTDDYWLIFKGKLVKKVGWEQTRELCKKLVAHPNYSGEKFSWGDEYINECAKSKVSTGNATTWRQVGTNHHITFVVNQISNFFSTLNTI